MNFPSTRRKPESATMAHQWLVDMSVDPSFIVVVALFRPFTTKCLSEFRRVFAVVFVRRKKEMDRRERR